jgi:hypothetical protein
MKEMRNAYRVLVENVERKTPFGISRGSRDDISKMNLKNFGCEGVVWIYLAQAGDQWRASVELIINHWIPYKVGDFFPN